MPSISITVRVPSDLVARAKEKLPSAGQTEIITTALKYWLGIVEPGVIGDNSTEERFTAIEEQLKALSEQIQGIDRSSKKVTKQPKQVKSDSEYLALAAFNQKYGTNFDRRSGVKAIQEYLMSANNPYEYHSGSFRFYLKDKIDGAED